MGRRPLPQRLPAFLARPLTPAISCGITRAFARLSPSEGQVTYVLLTRSPLSTPPKQGFPFDLHVLGTPPAFILSQDQTLRCVLSLHRSEGPKPYFTESVPPEPGLLPLLRLLRCALH
jgi:hypothetical protein